VTVRIRLLSLAKPRSDASSCTCQKSATELPGTHLLRTQRSHGLNRGGVTSRDQCRDHGGAGKHGRRSPDNRAGLTCAAHRASARLGKPES
jgi:hypothetical protein